MARESVDRLRARLQQKSAAVGRLLSTPDGQELMAALEDEFFDGPLFGGTPEKTAYNVGAREVVVYLRALRNYTKKKPQDEIDPLS